MSRVTTERGLDRLVNFSDAVTAVAVTLLVLPLIDLVGEGQTVADLFNEYSAQLISFIGVIQDKWMQVPIAGMEYICHGQGIFL